MTPLERQRYSRQLVLPAIGEEGQRRLLAASAVIVGCGALGSLQASALARAGVGRLWLVDRDCLELSNLHRQWLYDEDDLEAGLPKAIAAARRLARVNTGIEVHPVVADLNPSNIAQLLDRAEIILDGTDNFQTRYLINDYAVERGKPWIYGAALGTYGVTMPVVPGRTACLKCLYPEPPAASQPTCETEGILNAVPAAVAAIQAADAMKILCWGPQAVRPRITVLDLWEGRIREVEQPPPQPDCPACAQRHFVHLTAAEPLPVVLCGRNAVQIHERGPVELEALARRLAPLGEVRASQFALRFRTGAYELTVFPDGRAVIKGTSDPGLARSLYARYVGN
ncbi:MAG: ThiF family adenylyltransferase [Bryobacterales bacterium]|nr:ThiF family adenylyltransferase [Bryobacteraceae bacterium]MDW8131900.1 ThiF family adenylyltransferase [Bryobacterales bacterium]